MYSKPIKLCINNIPSDKYAVSAGEITFSWGIECDDNGFIQNAYRIKVFDGENALWDSEWKESENLFTIYNGKKLEPGMRIKWELELEGKNGERSETAYAEFRVVPPELTDVTWITQKNNKNRSAIYFLKQFKCDKKINRATLYASGIGCHSIRINGKQVDDSVLQPITSNFSKQCYFVTLNVEDFLNIGKNSIGIKVGDAWRRNEGKYLEQISEGRKIEFFGSPQLAAKLVLEYEDCKKEEINTDETWYAFSGGTIENNLFDGEIFDASKEHKGWDKADFDCSGYERAVTADNAGKIIPQNTEPIKIQRKINPISKTMIDNGVYIFDFGENVAGYAQIKIPEGMKAGDKLTLTFSEEINEYGELCMDTMRDARSEDEYISDGNDSGTVWNPEFTYHGFRYLQVKGWHGIPDLNSVTALVFYTDVDNSSFFESGSAIVNKIHECVLRTERDNLHGIATDCPQRDERMGWMNDATVRFEEIAYNFNVARLFPKIIDDIVAEQDEKGAISCTAPFVFGNRPADPVSSSFLIAGMQAWLHYGNKRIIEKNYSHFKAWNEYLKQNSDDGIVNFSHYGDWAAPVDSCLADEDPRSAVTPGKFMSTGYHYYNYKLLAKMAEILGDKKEQKINESEAERVRKAFLNKYWNDKTGIAATGSQGCQAFILWLRMLPEDEAGKAAENLHKAVADAGYRMNTGNLTSRYLMDMLAEYGYIDDAWRLITREEYPSFGYMLQNGATTIWERFEQKRNNSMNSHNHPMYGAVDSWFYSSIAGLVPIADGWKKYSVKPCIPKDLLYANAHLDTVLGDVGIKWFKRYDKLNIHVTVPYGAEAEYEYGCDKRVLKHGFHKFSYDI